MRCRCLWALIGLLALPAGCSNPFGRQYEYEEQTFPAVDGSAEVIVNSSVAALAALRGISIGPVDARPDRDATRDIVTKAGCPVTFVGRPWTRSGRHFVQIRLAVDHIASLSSCPLLSWSIYAIEPFEDGLRYRQRVGAPAGSAPARPAGVDWTGQELVAFRVYVPSRVRWHNIKRLEDGGDGAMERGNIGSWEQTLADRRAGKPVDIEVRMDAESILRRTLWLFAGSLVAAGLTMAAIVFFVKRRGRVKA
jgi:hypothetical protein